MSAVMPRPCALLASTLLRVLRGWVPGSVAEIRGAMGSGTADDYSDIDICWVVPDDSFTQAVDTVGAALSRTTAVLSLRTDPEFGRSARRRLVFARLYGMPLFWRVDIDIRARRSQQMISTMLATRTPAAIQDGPAPPARSRIPLRPPRRRPVARQTPLTFCFAAAASGLGMTPGPTARLADAITSLADACATQESSLTNMAAEVSQVVDRLLRSAQLGDGSHPEP